MSMTVTEAPLKTRPLSDEIPQFDDLPAKMDESNMENSGSKKEPDLPKQQSISQFLNSQKKQIEMALPKHLNSDRMLRIALTEIRKNPALEKCTTISLLGSVIQCSQLGLEPGNTLGHAYLIPYKNECQFIIGYRGMLDLARRSGQLVSISARCVYSNDSFNYCYGMDERCEHIPATGDRGDFFGTYVIARMKDGSHQFEFMNAQEINSIRDKSISYSSWVKYGKNGKFPIWVENYEEMARKTVIRRIFKYLPISVELQKAISLDEQSDRGDQNNGFIFDGIVDQKKLDSSQNKSDSLAEKLSV